MEAQLSGTNTRELWQSSTPPATNPASSQWPFWLVGGGVELFLGAFDPQAHSSQIFRLERTMRLGPH